jgi:hypothetical protein
MYPTCPPATTPWLKECSHTVNTLMQYVRELEDRVRHLETIVEQTKERARAQPDNVHCSITVSGWPVV